jgi:hypothetical protein
MDSGDNPFRQNQWGVFCVRHNTTPTLTQKIFLKKIKKKGDISIFTTHFNTEISPTYT